MATVISRSVFERSLTSPSTTTATNSSTISTPNAVLSNFIPHYHDDANEGGGDSHDSQQRSLHSHHAHHQPCHESSNHKSTKLTTHSLVPTIQQQHQPQEPQQEQQQQPHLLASSPTNHTSSSIQLPPSTPAKKPFYRRGIFRILDAFFFLFRVILFLFKFFYSYMKLVNHQNKQKQHCKVLLEEKVDNYNDYKQIALYLDQLEGYDLWKSENETKLYDFEQIENINYQIMAMLRKKDIHGLQWLLRAELHRNIAGINNVQLYECHTGTKQLIEEYIDLVSKSCHLIRESDELSLEEKLKFFRDTCHAFGRSALLLSGGGGLSMYHIGVVKSLYDSGILPKVISGSSGGSIVAAVLCTRRDEDLSKCFEPGSFKLEAFGGSDDTPERSAMRKINRLLNNGVIMDVNKLAQCIRENIGDLTFEEAYKISGRVLNITVSGQSAGYQTHEGLLNYLTAPNVLIWSAAVASCSLPMLYKAVPLMAKDRDGNIVPYHNFPNQKYQDGTLFYDLPITRLAELFNVNFYIASQVNPHVLPFISNSRKQKNSLFSNLLSLVCSEIKYRIEQLYSLSLIPERFRWFELVISQSYEAHVTIVPCDLNFENMKKILSNPTAEYINQAVHQGMRRTFPHMNRIENMLKIELTLDSCLRQVRFQLFKSSPQFAIQMSKSSSLFNLEEEDVIDHEIVSSDPIMNSKRGDSGSTTTTTTAMMTCTNPQQQHSSHQPHHSLQYHSQHASQHPPSPLRICSSSTGGANHHHHHSHHAHHHNNTSPRHYHPSHHAHHHQHCQHHHDHHPHHNNNNKLDPEQQHSHSPHSHSPHLDHLHQQQPQYSSSLLSLMDELVVDDENDRLVTLTNNDHSTTNTTTNTTKNERMITSGDSDSPLSPSLSSPPNVRSKTLESVLTVNTSNNQRRKKKEDEQ
ncbi:hypothetical protein FDP41_009290 [Naegleria fowleri]|uniref:PNPLA domain-containing protein n=1 Tax=Naegleria fowleri TaxID=5763 RepID=A0A6A5B297_NAEFO|nr:uncharacterized protein FDP41_009290 [Naegleria fowleri]KAF0972387.1 hypothetical protein FDP41_009290 [Naegleria fowleri]